MSKRPTHSADSLDGGCLGWGVAAPGGQFGGELALKYQAPHRLGAE